jgi:hypothetical protein
VWKRIAAVASSIKVDVALVGVLVGGAVVRVVGYAIRVFVGGEGDVPELPSIEAVVACDIAALVDG